VTHSGDLDGKPAEERRFGWLNKANMVLLCSYAVLLAIGLVGMHQLRHWALRTYDTSGAQENWSQWREETARQSEGEGPVARRKAKSDEPPALVLARDYFATLAVVFVLLGTVLFATIALMVRGAVSSPGKVRED